MTDGQGSVRMTEQCIVKKVGRGTVSIELKRKDECDGCKMCAFNNKKSLVVPAVCDIDVTVGQAVTVEMPTRSAGAVSLLIYAIPLLLILVGALLGLLGSVWLQIGLAGAGLAIGLVCAFAIDRMYRRKSGVMPKVIGVVEMNDADNSEIPTI